MINTEGNPPLEVSRVRDIQDLHRVTEEQLNEFAKAVRPELLHTENPLIMDVFAGAGTASSAVAEALSNEGFSPSILLVDHLHGILTTTKPEIIENLNIPTEAIVADLSRTLPLQNDSIDIVTCKMGLHEVQLREQRILLERIHQVTRPEGHILVWENSVIKDNDSEDTYSFNQIIKRKDELAGLQEMAESRYFTSREELIDTMTSAGFTSPTIVTAWDRIWNSFDRLDIEFDGDTSKLANLNSFIDERFASVSDPSEVQFQITHSGHGRQFIIPTIIISAKKE